MIHTDYVGISLDSISSGTSLISQNIIYSNTHSGGGITIRHISNTTIKENECHDFMQGIHLDDDVECTIHQNTVINSGYQGINIRYSDSNIVTNNIVRNSQQHGIAIVGNSINNILHHNRLDGNSWGNSYDIDGGPPQGPPTSQAYDEGSNNIWYDSDSQEGNIWSDYFGIGPYIIDGDANSVDLYPFHTTGLTPFLLIIIISPICIVILGIIFLRFKKKRKS